MARKRLKNCPIGLFEYEGTICLKTEYSLDECYTVEGGEIFCGDGSKTREEKGDYLVTPTSIEQIKKQAVTEKFTVLKEKLSELDCINNDALNEIFECIDELQNKP